MELHVTAAYWRDEELVIKARTDTQEPRIVQVPFPGSFDWEVSMERSCIGRPSEHGTRPCPWNRRVQHFPVCSLCDPMESPQCVFEPAGQADPDHQCPLCAREHVVYLAWHGLLPKVGMTLASRVATRLREQGADGYHVIETVPDRAAARRLERTISFLHHLPEWRTHKETFPHLARPVDWDRLEAAAATWETRLRTRHPEITSFQRIASHGIQQPLPSVPKRIPWGGRHDGRWLGGKGDHLFYEPVGGRRSRLPVGRPPVLAVKRSDLVGRRIVAAPSPAD